MTITEAESLRYCVMISAKSADTNLPDTQQREENIQQLVSNSAPHCCGGGALHHTAGWGRGWFKIVCKQALTTQNSSGSFQTNKLAI